MIIGNKYGNILFKLLKYPQCRVGKSGFTGGRGLLIGGTYH